MQGFIFPISCASSCIFAGVVFCGYRFSVCIWVLYFYFQPVKIYLFLFFIFFFSSALDSMFALSCKQYQFTCGALYIAKMDFLQIFLSCKIYLFSIVIINCLLPLLFSFTICLLFMYLQQSLTVLICKFIPIYRQMADAV